MTNVTTVSISANAIGETYPGIAITNLSIFDGTNLLVTANTGTASTTVTNPAAERIRIPLLRQMHMESWEQLLLHFFSRTFPLAILFLRSSPSAAPRRVLNTSLRRSPCSPLIMVLAPFQATFLMINGSLVQSEGYSTGVFYWTPPTNGSCSDFSISQHSIWASGIRHASYLYGLRSPHCRHHPASRHGHCGPGCRLRQPVASDPEGQANTIAIYIDNTNVLTGAGPILTGLLSTNMLLAGQHSIWAYVSDAYAGSYSTTNQLTLQGSQTPII